MDKNLPIEDFNASMRYAEQFIIKHRFETQDTETRWQLPKYQLIELPDEDTFYVPKSLKQTFKLYDLKFNEPACLELSCFRYMSDGKECSKTSPITTFKVANQSYTCCQPACQKNWINGIPLMDEVEFKDGKCERKISLFKKWCLFPDTRTDNPTMQDVPPFTYIDNIQTCNITSDYCEYYGLHFTPEKTCERTNEQAFVEDYLIGKTIYRSYNISQSREKFKQRKKRSTGVQLIKEASFDIGIDVAFWGARQLALKSIPLYSSPVAKIAIAKLQMLYGKVVVKSALTGCILRTVAANMTATIAIKAAACLSTASTVVGLVLVGLQLAGLIVDAIDPHRLNDIVDQEYLDNLKLVFTSHMHSMLRGETEITPWGIMTAMSEGELNEEERIIYLERSTEYLFNLDITAYGVDLKYQPGPTAEDFLNNWAIRLHNQTPKELENKMDSYFTQFSVISSIILGLFLAVSI